MRDLRQAHQLNGVPHVSCMGGTREEIGNLLQLYRALGCDRIVALRGDLPSGMARMGDLRYATDLVEFIRAEHGDTRLGVGHQFLRARFARRRRTKLVVGRNGQRRLAQHAELIRRIRAGGACPRAQSS